MIKTTKSRYPFRIGCTGSVFPDTITENVRRTAPYVDDVELMFVGSDDTVDSPFDEDISILKQLAVEHEISYTVHLPVDKKAGSHRVDERIGFVQAARGIIKRTAPLNPHGYILHLGGIDFNSCTEDVLFWRSAVNEACVHLMSTIDIDPRLICVENCAYPSEWHNELVQRFNFSFCFDIGHLWKYKIQNWLEILQTYLSRTRIIHLHGIDNGKDHQPLTRSPRHSLMALVDTILPRFGGVVTLEMFTEKDTFDSLELMQQLWER
ncbi:MAG: cobamide remodeling phosphodiesterase CbiR [Chitinivibrionales bacterium]